MEVALVPTQKACWLQLLGDCDGFLDNPYLVRRNPLPRARMRRCRCSRRGGQSTAGALDIHLVDSVDKKIAQLTIGSFGYERLFGMGATKIDPGGTLLFAGEVGTYKGPWANPDDIQKINGMMRYSQGTATDGFAVTGMAYSNKWNSTDQVPERAITSGQIGLYGEEDPTDGGNTSRFSLSARAAQTDADGSWKANLYFIHSTLDLFSNFTYFLTNPLQGDQFHQHDDRFLTGGNASGTFNGSFLGRPTETTFGVQIRDDAIKAATTAPSLKASMRKRQPPAKTSAILSALSTSTTSKDSRPRLLTSKDIGFGSVIG